MATALLAGVNHTIHFGGNKEKHRQAKSQLCTLRYLKEPRLHCCQVGFGKRPLLAVRR